MKQGLIAVLLILVSGLSAFAQTGHGLTVTHYVAPYASVSGATSDNEDRGSTAWSNATNPATPTTIGTAGARATAGNVVQLAPGNYSGSCPGGAASPVFGFANAGSSGSKITLVAQYPAALNTGYSGSWSKLRRTNDPTLDTCPIWGAQNHVTLDGVRIDGNDGGLTHTRGIFYFGYRVTGMRVTRTFVTRVDLGSSDDGDNYNVFHIHGAVDPVIDRNVVQDGFDDTGSHNEAVFTTYGARDFLLEYNTFDNVTIGAYIKGTDGAEPRGNRGIIRYNLMNNVKIGIEMSTSLDTGTDTVDIYQNIITLNPLSSTHTLAWENATGVPRYFRVWNNTLIGTGDEEQGIVAIENGVNMTGGVFRDNIVARFATGGGQVIVNAQQSMATLTTFNYNMYYANGSTPQFYGNGGNRNGLAAWQSAVSFDANSSVANPTFVNQAAGDYHLDTGSPALTASSTGGPVGAYITGSETIGAGAIEDEEVTVPDAPTIGTATAGNGQATVTFTAPADDGGSVITGYTVTSSPGGFTGTGSSSPITVTGLTNGVSYTFTVVATNAEGNSSPSSASNSVTPSAPTGNPVRLRIRP